jgi:hypothetical protein
MFEATSTSPHEDAAEIARHEVSEDGVHWRPYDPERDRNQMLHKRIVFAPPRQQD